MEKVHVFFPKTLIALADVAAERLGWTRSEYIRQAVIDKALRGGAHSEAKTPLKKKEMSNGG